MLNGMAKLNVFVDEIVFLLDFLEVGMDFRREGIVMRP